MTTFIVTVESPGHVPIDTLDVERAIVRYIASKDEEAERYGVALAGYKINVERR